LNTPAPSILSVATVPLLGGTIAARVVSFENLSDSKEHIAVVCGDVANQGPSGAPLVRLHSECLTGDVFGSARCDCGPQLQESLRRIGNEGGVVLYLRQEGRGIGLYNKLKSYVLQEKGLDTFEANHALSFGDDLRTFDVACEMLKALGISKVRLLTNNPEKVKQLERGGVQVIEVLSTGVFQNPFNSSYLRSKRKKQGHKIVIEDDEAGND
jgi:GTP cyclohydrolase II